VNLKEALQALLDGKKVRDKDWISGEYIHLPDNCIVDKEGEELENLDVFFGHVEFELYEKPKKPKLSAPAFVKGFNSSHWLLTEALYTSLEEAKIDCVLDVVIWPAIPNKDGYYEVPE